MLCLVQVSPGHVCEEFPGVHLTVDLLGLNYAHVQLHKYRNIYFEMIGLLQTAVYNNYIILHICKLFVNLVGMKWFKLSMFWYVCRPFVFCVFL